MSKKTTKKTTKKATSPVKDEVRLSQCMIVKNEERNIEKALEWARDVTIEQIVVDTGSTDRTVEMAEELGAKVFHFEWIKDFSAAKNYAIERASGNWIAFLDADEYYTPDDAKKLLPMLSRIQSDADMNKRVMAMSNPMVQLNDDGKPMEVFQQERIFRNHPSVRYFGRIHERLSIYKAENFYYTEDISIMHTGYTDTAFEETKKASRNIELLRAELVDNPNDLSLKAYLADALKAEKDDESLEEAEALYMEVITSPGSVILILKNKAYKHFLDQYTQAAERIEEYEEFSRMALKDNPTSLDFKCYYAAVLSRNGDYRQAFELLKECEAKMSTADVNDITVIAAKPQFLFGQMVLAAQGLGDVEEVIKYATMILAIDKSRSEVLAPYLHTLASQGVSMNEVITILSGIYDLNDPQDLLLIARTAKDIGAIELARAIMDIAGRIMNG